MNGVLALSLGLLIAACAAKEPRRALSTPHTEPSVERPHLVPAGLAEATPVPAIPKEPAVASYAALLTKRLREWDTQLGQELSGLDLSLTAGADPERSRLFLEHRLRQELAVPAPQRSNDPRWESAGPPYDEEACLAGPPEASRQCAEIAAASALFIGVLETLPELESNPRGAEEAALNLALAFERLTLSGLSASAVTQFYVQWRSRAGRPRA